MQSLEVKLTFSVYCIITDFLKIIIIFLENKNNSIKTQTNKFLFKTYRVIIFEKKIIISRNLKEANYTIVTLLPNFLQ